MSFSSTSSSSAPHYLDSSSMDFLTRLNLVIGRGTEEVSLGPQPIVLLPRSTLVAQMQKERQDYQIQVRKKTLRPLASDLAFEREKTFSQESLESGKLKRISFSNLKARQTHLGRYLLCRTILLPVPTSFVSFDLAVLDPEGNALRLSLFHYPLLPLSLGRNQLNDLDDVFPVGTVLVVLEPSIRMNLEGTLPFCRVDSPTDVRVVKSSRDFDAGEVVWKDGKEKVWKPVREELSFEVWKEMGNKAFSSRRYLAAERAYSSGIEQHPNHPTLYLLHLNRAATNLFLQRYHHVVADCERVFWLLDNILSVPTAEIQVLEIKARLRRAKALYALRRWKDASQAFQSVVNLFPNSANAHEAKLDLEQSKARIREQETGEFDFLYLWKQGLAKFKVRFDVADFVGPVEVVPSSSLPSKVGGRRAVITTRDVKAGDLLFATKAVACSWPQDLLPSDAFLWYNIPRTRIDAPSEVLVQAELIYKLYFQPELRPSIFGLSSSPSAPSSTSKQQLPPSYDLTLPPPLPSFPPSPSPTRPSRNLLPGEDPSPPILHPQPLNTGLLQSIERYNSILQTPLHLASGEGLLHDGYVALPPHTQLFGMGLLDRPVSLFGPNSLIGHSCDYNTLWSTLGDMHVVRAISEIPKGGEVVVSFAIDGSFEDRERILAKHVGEGGCRCGRCEDDRKDGRGKVTRRGRIVEEVKLRVAASEMRSKSAVEIQIRELKKVVEELRGTYGNHRTKFKPEMHDALARLALAYETLALLSLSLSSSSKANLFKDAIKQYELSMESLGVEVRGDEGSAPPVTNNISSSSVDGLPILCGPRAFHSEAISAAIKIAYAWSQIGNEGSTRSWLRAAVWMEELTVAGVGKGRELFKGRYRAGLEGLGLMRFVV